jgi:Spy/CpxP family protein refolding chaperone
MKRIQWASVPGLALLLGAGACGGSAQESTAPATAADVTDVAPAGTAEAAYDDDSTAELKDHDRHHHHGGFAMFIAMSLDSLGTSPEEDANLAKIQADIRAKLQPAHDAEKNLMLTLADGVAAGNIDQAKVDAAVAQVSSAAAGVHDAVADSLNQLHEVLTPEQRVALADKVEAHLQVWRDANSDGEPSKVAREGRLAELQKSLALTQDQVEKVRATLSSSMARTGQYDWKEGEASLEAFRTAFVADHFDAKSLGMGGAANAHIATWGAARMSRFYEAVGPVLSADQRARLADILRRHANYSNSQTAT